MSLQLERSPRNPLITARPHVSWEDQVFNGSVIYDEGTFHLVYRALRPGYQPIAFERFQRTAYQNFISDLGYGNSLNGVDFTRDDSPLITPEYEFERWGVEDPRVTKLDDYFYIHYTALRGPAYEGMDGDGKGHVRSALARTKDFTTIEKLGIIGPGLDHGVDTKAATFFPERINGNIGMLITIDCTAAESSILYVEFADLDELLENVNQFWAPIVQEPRAHALFASSALQQQRSPGAGQGFEVGAPPIRTEYGWLLFTSMIDNNLHWSIGACLLQNDNPRNITHQLPYALLQPEASYEIDGLIPDVCFPQSAVVVGEEIMLYYGASDSSICLATTTMSALCNELMKFPTT